MVDIATILTAAAVKESTGPLASFLNKVGKRRYDAIIAKYTNAFSDHLDVARKKVSDVKNLIYRNQSAKVVDKYVNVEFKVDRTSTTDLSVIEGMKKQGRYLISGTGGAGKTMFMKWATLQLLDSIPHHQMIPLFLELRDVSKGDAELPFENIIFRYTSSIKNAATLSQFIEGMRAGVFVLVLDAVDEINHEIRESLIRSLDQFTIDFPDAGIMISTRPNPALESALGFQVLSTKQMTLKQVEEILDKVDYDDKVREKLIGELKSGLYDKHKDFLSNPLLVTIMLLTYDHSGEIPTKMTSFYKQAFETLYQRHDATKGAVYKRKLHAGLPMDEFERMFAAFCYRSFINSKFEFSDTELMRYFREALDYCDLDEEPNDVVTDAMESVCLIHKDGLDNVFAHRSFQEYFVAVFVSLYRGDNLEQIIKTAVYRNHSDNLISMLFEADNALFEDRFVIPSIEKLVKKIERLDLGTSSGLLKFFKIMLHSFELRSRDGSLVSYRWNDNSGVRLCGLLESVYPECRVTEHIFDFKSNGTIFGNYNNFLSKNQDKFRTIKSLSIRKKDDQFRLRIEPTATNVKWLLDTKLPSRMQTIQKELVLLRNRIISSRKRRLEAGKNILSPLEQIL